MTKVDTKEYDRNPKSVIHRYFDSDSDSDDNYPDDIDEFEYNEDGHAIFPFLGIT